MWTGVFEGLSGKVVNSINNTCGKIINLYVIYFIEVFRKNLHFISLLRINGVK